MKEGVNGVHTCDDCETTNRRPETLCDKCRMKRCQSGAECKSCTKIVSSLILEQNKKLHNENNSLKEIIKDIAEENKDLKKENKDMKDNISMASFILNGRSL